MSFITVASFVNMFDLTVIKIQLEDAGIPCFVKDEHTMQANPLYGPAIGFIKLQVMEQHAEQAILLLQEIGFLNSNPEEQDTAWKKFDTLTQHLPILKYFGLITRAVIIVSFTALLAFTLLLKLHK